MLHLLATGTVHVLGRMRGASNETLLTAVEGRLGADGRSHTLRAVLKTRAGERALTDFPPGTLSHREVAAFLLSDMLGLDVVPPTVWRDDLGGSLQAFVETDPAAASPVVLTPPGQLSGGLVPILRAQLDSGAEVVLAHSPGADTRALAFFDALIDNADRKGGHVLAGAWFFGGDQAPETRAYGIDNGLSFNTAPTLRTVLWGFAGEPLTTEEADRAARASDPRFTTGLRPHLAAEEVDALHLRAAVLVESGHMPLPPVNRRAVPWPPI